MVKPLLKRLLAFAGYALVNTRRYYACDGLNTLHNDSFRRDPAFRDAYARGLRANQGIDPQWEWRAHVAMWTAMNAVRIAGDFVECGVNNGFISSAIMQRLNWQDGGKTFYLVDTFAGPVLTQYSEEEIRKGRLKIAEDALAAGSYSCDVEQVRQNFSQWPSAVVIQGAVPDVLAQFDDIRVAFLHIDMNCAMPERAALEFFWDRLSSGGFVLLDDYTYLGHESQSIAIGAVARQLGAEILSLPTGQGLIIK